VNSNGICQHIGLLRNKQTRFTHHFTMFVHHVFLAVSQLKADMVSVWTWPPLLGWCGWAGITKGDEPKQLYSQIQFDCLNGVLLVTR